MSRQSMSVAPDWYSCCLDLSGQALTGNYKVAPKEEKQSIMRNGFPCVAGTISSAEELISLTPLKRITDAEYSNLYEQLVAAWGNPQQKKVAAMMKTRLATIHDLLPRHKIRDDFRRVRAGREEPLPLYVRNEIHHPTTDGLPKSKTLQNWSVVRRSRNRTAVTV